MLIAVPSDTTDGLDAPIAEHFGHCAAFTLIEVADNGVGEISILENAPHGEAGCMAPVMRLKERGVDVLLAGGLGARPLAGFQQVGIEVRHTADAATVADAVELFIAGGCPAFADSQTCGGGEGSCGHDHHHHHHHEIETVPIEGTADVRDGRLITVEYEVKDAEGNLLDASAQTGPMRFVFGAGQIFPAIEQALAGLEPKASAVAQVPMADGFGERNEKHVFEVPRSQLPPNVTVGTRVTAESEQGARFPLTVIGLDDEVARLDANHPFAGKDLTFEMTVASVEGLKSA